MTLCGSLEDPSTVLHRGDGLAMAAVSALAVVGVSAGAHAAGGADAPAILHVLLALGLIGGSVYGASGALIDRLRRGAWVPLIALFGAGQLLTHLFWGMASSFTSPTMGGAHHHGGADGSAGAAMIVVHLVGTAISLALTMLALAALRHLRASLVPLLTWLFAVVVESRPRLCPQTTRPVVISVPVTILAPHRGPPAAPSPALPAYLRTGHTRVA